MPIYAPQFDCYQTRLTQLVDGLEHVYRFYHIPGNYADPPGNNPADYEVTQADLNLYSWEAWVEDFLGEFEARFFDDTTFTTAELWRADADTLDFQFLSAFSPATQPSTSGTYTPAVQTIYTARTSSGGILRLTALEGRTATNLVLPWVALNGGNSQEQLAYDNCIAATRAIVDRQGTFAFSPLKINDGQNERVWRKRFRS